MRLISSLFKRSFAPVLAGASFYACQRRQTFVSRCESEAVTDEWMAEKQKCPLCRLFLESACRDQFIAWSKCVDEAKASEKDFVQECAFKFEPLLKCQGENREYFEEVMRVGEYEDDVSSENESGESELEEIIESVNEDESTGSSRTEEETTVDKPRPTEEESEDNEPKFRSQWQYKNK